MKNYNIVIADYNIEWPSIFAKEAKIIHDAFGTNCIAIHHIGSTSVEGLAAKPKIDIIVVLKSNHNAISILESIGYCYRGELNIPFRLYFRKKDTNPEFNLHVYEEGNPEIELNLLFRDYLRKSPKLCEEYMQLKYNLIKDESSHYKHKQFFVGYTLAKNKFIKNILKQAKFSGICLRICVHQDEWTEYHRIRKKEIFDTIENLVYDPSHRTISDPNHNHLVLYKGTKIIGIAQVEFKNSDYCILRSIAIDKHSQGKGYGKHLLMLIEKWIKSKGVAKIYLHTDDAVVFYKKLGYQEMYFEDNDGLNMGQKIDLGKKL